MDERYSDVVDMFIESERLKEYHDIELHKREVLEDFFDYLDEVKDFEWSIKDITAEDGQRYYEELNLSDKRVANIDIRMNILNRFMDFAAGFGLIEKNPWKDIFEGEE